MKFNAAVLLAASASAVSLPRVDYENGADQFPNSIGFGTSSGWSEFPPRNPNQYGNPLQGDPPQYNPYSSNPYSNNPYNSNPNPYNSQPYNSNPYNSNPYNSNPYNSNPYGGQNSYGPPPPPAVPPPPSPPPYNPPGLANDPNAPIVPQSAADVPTQVTIEKTSYSGNGCPAGSVSTIISPDKTVVTFGFDVFQATIGPRANPADKQKNCQLHLGLKYPSGYQMSIMTATYHGYVRLDPGVQANFISSYYFSQAAEKTVRFLKISHFKIANQYRR
jgi:uncharacterized protein DUF4360